ncbi:MAG: hypothetical protein ACK5KR_09115 [Breznakia sp.]
MKRLFSLVLVLGLFLTGCGSAEDDNDIKEQENDSSYQEKLKEAGFKENMENQIYELDLDNGDKVFVFVDDGYINYENNEDDAQISYYFKDNYADMYGCRYHYEDDSYTEDGAGTGGCIDETVDILKKDKEKIDKVFKDAKIKYEEIAN